LHLSQNNPDSRRGQERITEEKRKSVSALALGNQYVFFDKIERRGTICDPSVNQNNKKL
jgi:hypothetical protein